MLLYKDPDVDTVSSCPYFPDKNKQFEYFLAADLTSSDVSYFLEKGWRKFGLYYFRPLCPVCNDCTPVRVLAQDFKPSKSQRRILNRNHNLKVSFGPLKVTERVYEIYKDHSKNRFEQGASYEDFLQNFYTPSCPSIQSEYYLDDELIGVGFLDVGSDCINSIYFVFDTSYSSLRLGTYSILKEIEFARAEGHSYYYLGYYIGDCQSMAYKNKFSPHQLYDWNSEEWKVIE